MPEIPDGSVRRISFIERHKGWFSFLATALILGTFLVKDYFRERLKDRIDEQKGVVQSYQSYAQNDDIRIGIYDMQVRIIELYERAQDPKFFKSSDKMFGRKENAERQPALNAIVSRTLTHGIGLCQFTEDKDTCRKRFEVLSQALVSDKKTYDEMVANEPLDTSAKLLELRNMESVIVAQANEWGYFADLCKKHREEAVAYIEQTQKTGEKSIEESERQYKRITQWSYVAYVAGFILAFLGKRYGVEVGGIG